MLEWLKKGPLTAALIPQVKRLDCTICDLRKDGWPITTRLETHFDCDGRSFIRAEYRLGNWHTRALQLR